MYLVDTHQHLWDLDRFPYSWCAGIPTLNRSFRINDYEAAARGLDIRKSVFVECDVDEPHGLAEATFISSVADLHPSISGIVATCRPEQSASAFRAHLEALRRLPKARGVRRVLHTQPDGLASAPGFAENVNLLAEFGFTFDVCVLARQLPLAISLVARCPGVTFILDHCGVPDVKGRSFEPWRKQLAELAQYPNVHCKISGLVAYADSQSWTDADLRPWIEHALVCFGWDRVLWGSDWPVCTLSASLGQWVESFRRLTGDANEHERAKLYHLNAERIYRV